MLGARHYELAGLSSIARSPMEMICTMDVSRNRQQSALCWGLVLVSLLILNALGNPGLGRHQPPTPPPSRHHPQAAPYDRSTGPTAVKLAIAYGQNAKADGTAGLTLTPPGASANPAPTSPKPSA